MIQIAVQHMIIMKIGQGEIVDLKSIETNHTIEVIKFIGNPDIMNVKADELQQLLAPGMYIAKSLDGRTHKHIVK